MKVKEFLEVLSDIDSDYCITDENGNGIENYFHADGLNNFYQEELDAVICNIYRMPYGIGINVVGSIYETHQEYLDDIARINL